MRYLLGITIFALAPSLVLAATLSLTPVTGSLTVGETLAVQVVTTSAEQPLNAISGTINFPPALVEVVGLSKASSLFTYWVAEPSFDNATGVIKFEGVVPNPGWRGASGQILTVRFRGKQAGQAGLNFTGGSVLANDGEGTNLLQNFTGAQLTIKPIRLTPPPTESTTAIAAPEAPEITSSTHPDPSRWYANNNPKFDWVLPPGIIGVNILADREPNTNPGVKSDGLFSTYDYEKVKDGVWYVHLRLQNKAGWGDISHFAFRIDTVSPIELKLDEAPRTDPTDPLVKFEITATDPPAGGGSGIDHYEVSLDSGVATIWRDLSDHLYEVGRVKPGQHSLLVKVYDAAGNQLAGSADFTVAPLEPPTVTNYPKELTTDDILKISGRTYPNATTVFSIQEGQAPAGEIFERSVPVDANGQFLFTFDQKLESGVYKYRALVRDRRGAESLFSPSLTTAVAEAPFLRLSRDLIKWLSLVVPILALLLLLIIIILWSWSKFMGLKRKLRRESREASDALHKVFDLLRTRAREQLAILEIAKAKRALTKEEEILAKSLAESLDSMEQYVRKEIGDVENLA